MNESAPEELKIRAEHKQELAGMANEHEREMAAFDRQAMRKCRSRFNDL